MVYNMVMWYIIANATQEPSAVLAQTSDDRSIDMEKR